tara:strand:+ start:1682 stop:2065 length:384 start_codon:yes stop_codon:yes gene_type:complete
MNFYSAIQKYQNTDMHSKVESSSKHGFVKIVLEELSQNLKILKYSIENEQKLSKNKSKSFARIITSLSILMSSLDFEKGEPIASNLFGLYEYCKKEVLASYKNLDTKGLDDTIIIVEDILSAWTEIG